MLVRHARLIMTLSGSIREGKIGRKGTRERERQREREGGGGGGGGRDQEFMLLMPPPQIEKARSLLHTSSYRAGK